MFNFLSPLILLVYQIVSSQVIQTDVLGVIQAEGKNLALVPHLRINFLADLQVMSSCSTLYLRHRFIGLEVLAGYLFLENEFHREVFTPKAIPEHF